ncbi:CopM family metallochaperone [Neisseria sp. Ec49-e6-T10]|uniref:CopM family metallochaperone n=1 Tax=Neisseria sp. Ec49-e6-T10 TaxID=3140744 RepID=UPI003EBF3D4D
MKKTSLTLCVAAFLLSTHAMAQVASEAGTNSESSAPQEQRMVSSVMQLAQAQASDVSSDVVSEPKGERMSFETMQLVQAASDVSSEVASEPKGERMSRDTMQLAQADMNHVHDSMMAEPKSAYQEDMDKMHQNMMIQPSGNADIDFVRGMIPHHQGAIDMARTELKHGVDPELRKLSEDIIKAQEKEIKFMQEWLRKNDKSKK